jgi:hypothetical protein
MTEDQLEQECLAWLADVGWALFRVFVYAHAMRTSAASRTDGARSRPSIAARPCNQLQAFAGGAVRPAA